MLMLIVGSDESKQLKSYNFAFPLRVSYFYNLHISFLPNITILDNGYFLFIHFIRYFYLYQ